MSKEYLTEQLYSIVSQYIDVLADPIIVIPVVAAWCISYLFSQSKYVTGQLLQSEKNLRVYSLNAIVAVVLFNIVADPIEGTRTIVSILIGGLAIMVPYVWFEVYKKKKK